MNLIAFIAAVAGLSVLWLILELRNKIKSPWLRYAFLALGVVASLATMSTIPSFTDAPVSASRQAGQYTFYLLIPFFIVRYVLRRRKTKDL